MEELIAIDLGGSIITHKHKPYTPRKRVIRRLAREIKSSGKRVIISHGSGSFGHTSAVKYGGTHGYKSKWGFCKVGFDAMHINKIVIEEFINLNVPVFSFRPASLFMAKSGHPGDIFTDPIKLALKQNLLPVIYGDVIFDSKWQSTIFSGEYSLQLILKELNSIYRIAKVIHVGVVDGLLDNEGKVIPEVNTSNWPTIQQYFYECDKIADVTGGIKEKLSKALEMAEFIPSVMLINGNLPNRLYDALTGKPVINTTVKL